MKQQCKISIIVPVFNEDSRLIERMFASLRQQRAIAARDFEVLLVINNDLPGTKKYEEIFANNQKIITTNWSEFAFPVHIVDCSSLGQELRDCSVGKARDIGVHEAALRFAAIDHNGILLQVDADVYFSDHTFLKKILDVFEDEKVIGLAGGKHREALLDDYPPEQYPDRLALAKALRAQGLVGRCKYLLNYSKGDYFLYRVFGGSNMASRAYESVLAGGVPHRNFIEDWYFGFALEEYAKQHHQRCIVDRDIQVTATFRISERTGSSFKDAITGLMAGVLPTAPHPKTGEELVLNDATYARLREEVRRLPDGAAFVDYMDTYGVEVTGT